MASRCRHTGAMRLMASISRAEAREPDPQRLLEVYHASSATLNLTRAFVTGGFAHLRSVHSWNADFVKNSAAGVQYQNLANEIDRALAFMVACGIDDDVFRTVDFYSSHEALILEYEHALTRIDSRTGQPYGTSGHFLWIGERTRQLHGAHVELTAARPQPTRGEARAGQRPPTTRWNWPIGSILIMSRDGSPSSPEWAHRRCERCCRTSWPR